MNDYGFDYMNYITNIPNNNILSQNGFPNNNYITNNQINPNKNNEFLKPYEGFIRGNIFKNLYDQYKNYTPKDINAKNERDALLYQIMQYKFNLVDLNLYLDINPNDRNAINLYNNYLNMINKMCDKYESMYGPLTLDNDNLINNTWIWNNGPWPWEVM